MEPTTDSDDQRDDMGRFVEMKTAVEGIGGYLRSDPGEPADVVLFAVTCIPLEVMRAIGACGVMDRIDLTQSGISDEGLTELRALSSLDMIRLGKTAVTGYGMRFLPRTTRRIDLSGCVHLTSEGFGSIARLEGLKVLELDRSSLSDSFMQHIASLRGLVSLNLSHTSVTDGGLQAIDGLSELRRLSVIGTVISEEHLADYYRRHPNLVRGWWA